ncbi:hypothetical protein EYF80_028916 [Liparis tanakae]|uniref:Uncharacterized protein n=1 Tax=Liparis tanakae TaxID=230148 RepID=A0A4Z2H5K9_9TELE|nr:hypothetical protein EYF80_028916 [Liparis tanakae]
MKSLGSLSSLLFLLSSVELLLSQLLCASSSLSLALAAGSSPSRSSLSRLKPELWPGLEAETQERPSMSLYVPLETQETLYVHLYPVTGLILQGWVPVRARQGSEVNR